MIVCVLALGYSSVRLCIYGIEYFTVQKTSNEMRELYYEESPDTPQPAAVVPDVVVPAVSSSAMPSPAPTESHPAETESAFLPEAAPYPRMRIGSRFTKLRRQNEDIIGWLEIEDVLDEPVVQRDNEYYLRRDYRGYHNSNGAVFLEETCDLSKRPYTQMLYAHNMKTGAMFGALRNYENTNYYHNSPFIHFDSIYEEGLYVIFAVNTISLNPAARNYIDFAKLCSLNIEGRNAMLQRLKKQSIHDVGIDVEASDRLLLLITCTADDNERRVVAARLLRDDETQEAISKIVKKSRKRD